LPLSTLSCGGGSSGGAKGGPLVVGALPVIAGNLAPHATGTASVTIDFSSCQPGAVFKATFSLSANGGAATGTVVKTSQMP